MPLSGMAGIAHLLPTPAILMEGGAAKSFALGRNVKITDPSGCGALRSLMADAGCTIVPEADAVVDVRMSDRILPAGFHEAEADAFPSERYMLMVKADSVIIAAESPTGVLRAAQTLRQLALDDNMMSFRPALESVGIIDYPSFPVRGFMHDTGRSYIPVDELKRHIELLSMFKINVFHWHLTENQAWRFEVKAYPQLTSAESMVRDEGKFYTQDECRELEAFAHSLGVTVIPEIDMPGHSAAFERAMGHSMQTDEGVKELEVILGEVAEAFPLAPYIHIGADEQAITYPGFIEKMSARVHGLGRKVMAWNPIHGKSVTPDLGIDMQQLWSTRGTAGNGIPSIDCRYNYANHFDIYSDLAGIFFSNIYYRNASDADVKGTIQAYWNDRRLPDSKAIARENNFYANMLAMAENAWNCRATDYIEQRGVGLSDNPVEMSRFKNWEDRFMAYKNSILPADEIPYMAQSDVEWTLTDNRGRRTKARGAGVYLRHTWGQIIPTRLPYYLPGDTVWAERTVVCDSAMVADAFIEFQNYSRSEKDLAPESGQWDRKGSKIWINGEEILPPLWQNTGKSITNEDLLLNENIASREPVKVMLEKGVNHIKVMVPCVDAPGVRLNKWMFTVQLADARTGRTL